MYGFDHRADPDVSVKSVAPQIVTETKILGEEKHKSMQESTDRTKEKLEDAIKASKGN